MVLPCGTGLENNATVRLHNHAVTLLLWRLRQQMPAAPGEQVVVCVLPFYVPCDVSTRVCKRLMVHASLTALCVAGTRTVTCGRCSTPLQASAWFPESLSLSHSRRPLCLIRKHLERIRFCLFAATRRKISEISAFIRLKHDQCFS